MAFGQQTKTKGRATTKEPLGTLEPTGGAGLGQVDPLHMRQMVQASAMALSEAIDLALSTGTITKAEATSTIKSVSRVYATPTQLTGAASGNRNGARARSTSAGRSPRPRAAKAGGGGARSTASAARVT
jgi:hypothetical protein